MLKYQKKIFQYDELLGHRFLPNKNVRINRYPYPYFNKTNAVGFRSDKEFKKERDSNKSRIVCLGDSFCAGDGVDNRDRITDLLMNRFNIETYNLGLSGSGHDQHLLIQENYAASYEHDAVVCLFYISDVRRNMNKYRVFQSDEMGKGVKVYKPCFRLDNNNLVQDETTIPTWDSNVIVDKAIKKKNYIKIIYNVVIHKFVYFVLKIDKRLGNFIARIFLSKDLYISDYLTSKTKEWMLCKAIMQKIINNSNNKPVIIIPIPSYDYFFHDFERHYIDRYKELEEMSNVQVIDIIPGLRKIAKGKKEKYFIPLDGHFTSLGNVAVERVIAEHISKNKNLKSIFKEKFKNKAEVAKVTKHKDRVILGISCFYHDSAAAIIKNDNIIAAAQEERFTRKKQDNSFPINAIAYCLEEAGIDINCIDVVCYYDNIALTFERLMMNQLLIGKKGKPLFVKSMTDWMTTKFSLQDLFQGNFGYTGLILQNEHHRSHAASAFFASPFQNAVIVTCDGVGEFATTSIGIGNGNSIKLLKEMYFPHSIGLLYSAFTAFTGFKVNSGEYKMMGLAPYGKPEYVDAIEENILTINKDGSIVLNMDYFDFRCGEKMFNEKVNNLFDGPARMAESIITQREMDIAKSIQVVVEKIMLLIVAYAKKISGEENLVLAGGVALNCVANGKILKESEFRDLWIQPAAGDAGGALGACLDVYHTYYGGERIINDSYSIQKASLLGPKYENDEIKTFFDQNKIKCHKMSSIKRAQIIAKHIFEGKIVGHFSDRMEFGPRALGARSIIADPRSVEMQTKLNLKIKYRESFRPFAPAVLEEKVSEYFELDCKSPHMLLVANVKKERCNNVDETQFSNLMQRLKQKRSDIPAITHVDFSARVQTVNKEHNKHFYDIIKEFEKLTNIAVLINTSFNVRGEPIVCTPEDAYRCFMQTEMDILVVEDFILLKEEQPKVKKKDWLNELKGTD